ncbi:uncharacterized protein LOC126895303 isoform X2 [Daktulosphaira vitifoliae]|uniref:uncharacterized protein LOC126895303 isoform X2 n=1 Tax=Daktulosphaira vitifoliae TaxID=58002 RepID=UPI0021AA2908|nr:uncharacterized protein LOC126895303 isoform X2 [Daktulosphaira vitifoliae]
MNLFILSINLFIFHVGIINVCHCENEKNENSSTIICQCEKEKNEDSSTKECPYEKEKIEDNSSKDVEICAICFNEVNDECYKTPCNHEFCKKCMDQWLQKGSTCPICRYLIKENNGNIRNKFERYYFFRRFL